MNSEPTGCFFLSVRKPVIVNNPNKFYSYFIIVNYYFFINKVILQKKSDTKTSFLDVSVVDCLFHQQNLSS